MKTLFALFALAALSLQAQSQEGSVAIAENIRPTELSAHLMHFAACVAELKETGTKDKDARNACLKMAGIEADVTKRVANEAADATKASRPILLYSRYGGSYYGGRGYGFGYSSSRRRSSSADYRIRADQRAAESKARADQRALESEAREKQRAAELKARSEQKATELKDRQERRAAELKTRAEQRAERERRLEEKERERREEEKRLREEAKKSKEG